MGAGDYNNAVGAFRHFGHFFSKKMAWGLIFCRILVNFVVGLVMEAKSTFHYRRFLYEYQQFGVNCRHL